MPTYTPKAGDTTRSWYVIDATDVVLGRLAVAAANLLRGKHKPTFTPNVDGGDFVIVINADKVAISGDKLQNKFAYRHSGYPGGLRTRTIGELMEKHPDRVVEKAIVGMLPQNKLGRQIQKKLQRLRRAGASAHRPAAGSVRDQAGGPVTETTETEEADEPEIVGNPEAAETVEAETEAAAEAAAPREPVVIDRPIQTVGRRKEAVVRVRLVPGTGKFNLDGRTLEAYFPNKVHQQLIKAPLVTVDRVDSFDIYAHLDGGGPSGQAGALRLAHRPGADPGAARGPARAEEGRLPHPRPAGHRAQEVRPEEGPQGASVQQALIAASTYASPRRARSTPHQVGHARRIFSYAG